MLLASLPWYDLKEVRSATNILWDCLSSNLRKQGFTGVPATLNRHIRYVDQWTSGKLLFSQACGYDVLLPYNRYLRVVASPAYAEVGCQGTFYRSVIIVREDSQATQLEQLRGARAVINSLTSHSGMNVLRALAAPLHRHGRFFSSVCISGSHETSLAMVRGRLADIAPIDCVTYGLLERHRPQALNGTRALCYSRCVPAPPFVTSSQSSEESLRRIRSALFETLEAPAIQTAKRELLLDRVEVQPADTYGVIGEWERVALETGYSDFTYITSEPTLAGLQQQALPPAPVSAQHCGGSRPQQL